METKLKDETFSPRVGIVYQPWPWLSLYGSFTESFGTNNGRMADGQALDPQQATQYELGVKTELWDGRLTSTLAFYHLTKSNVPTADTSTPSPDDVTLIGEARSQGIELDVSGQLTDKLSLIGSFSHTDGKITKDNDGFAGNRLLSVPEYFGSLWTKYQVTESFSLGTGIFAATESQGDRANSFELPGYVRWDAMAAYRFRLGKSRMTAQVNVNNLLDERYYQDSSGGGQRLGVVPADPRTVLGSIRIEY